MSELIQDPSPEGIQRLLERKIAEGKLEGDPQALLEVISLDKQFNPTEMQEVRQAFFTQQECIAPALWQAIQAMKKKEQSNS